MAEGPALSPAPVSIPDLGTAPGRQILRWAAFVLLFIALDRLSFVDDLLGISVTPWSPKTGLAVAFLLIRGAAQWPVVALASVLADLLIRDMPLGASIPSAVSYALVFALAAGAFRRIRGASPQLERPRDLALFMVVAALAVVPATIFRIVFVTDQLHMEAGWFVQILTRRVVGDLAGIALFAPLFVRWAAHGWRIRRPSRERAGQFALAAVVNWVVFGLESTDELRFFYVLFPPVIWVALRGGLFPTLLLLAMTQLCIIAATTLRDLPELTVTALQLLMLTLAVTGILMAATADMRQRAERALRDRWNELSRLSRVHATSEIAAGLAHELKQPLAAILNFLAAGRRLLDQSPPAAAEAADNVRLAEAQVLRADEIVRRIRDFVRKGEARRQPVELARCIHEAQALVQPLAERHRVRIGFDEGAPLPRILADEIQTLQILVNLMSNAIQAIAEAAPAVRRIDLAARVLAGGREIELAVSDSGPGLSAAIVEQIFQPFVTGRPDGIGIGLSISRAMAEAQGGALWHDPPEPGKGATFRLTLPIVPTGAHDRQA
ncbi:ATP-binding protein [Magnetospirillum sp. UT-4]|uniref:ATP-binding protein n=1 Tax=Magnetospirillum sp. UT-4 TaxID=2681467 RepID=UPI00137EE307|nr:ATP-binding protein [Magnetospirillum sp. UT-4]CAA7616844.1 putative Two-component sensor histidine kinase [Magnetospirillum sp. UT-4]